jgi:hypothetical protein
LRELGRKKKDLLIIGDRQVYMQMLPEYLPEEWMDEYKYWRCVYRFYISTWLTFSEHRDVGLILQGIINMNNHQFTVEA